MQNQIESIYALLKDFDTAMLVTHGSEMPFNVRPMAIAQVELNCDVWFFTGRSSAKAREIQNDQEVLIVCQDGMSRYIALHASAKLIFDPNKSAELWRESYRSWFPAGVDDPDLVLIRAQARHAEYWDNQGFKSVRYLFEAAKAYVRGTRPHVTEGEQHGTVNFSE
jgi:general stress protein 26